MTDTTPADQLRQAASLLRDKATNAIHEGRTTWSTGRTLGSRSPVVVDDQEQPSVLIETYAARLERVNSYLALLGPATGLAVADWLDSAAEDAEQIGADHHALVVARQVLGTTGQPETGRSCRRSDCLAPGHRFMLGSTVYTCTGEPTALPAPVDRAAILREAADAVLDIIGADARLPQTISGVYRAADHLRRLAGEAQQLAPAVTEEPTL